MMLAMVRVMVRAAVVVSVASLCGCNSDSIGGVTGNWKPGTAAHDVSVGTLTRRYLVHVPAKRPTTAAGFIRSYPLVIVLHGSSGSAEEIRQTTKMDVQSETDRFLVAYPEGMKGAGGLFPSDWNAGTCCGAAGGEKTEEGGLLP